METNALEWALLIANATGEYDVAPQWSTVVTNDYSGYNNCLTFKSLVDQAMSTYFSLGTGFYNQDSDGKWVGVIPMYGMELMEVTVSDLYNTSSEKPLILDEIYMLRSLVKVRLLDETVKTDGYPQVVYRYLTGEDSNGKLTYESGGVDYLYRQPYNLPCKPMEYVNGYQINDINVKLTSLNANSGRVADVNNTDKEEPGVVYNSYMPEQYVEYNSQKNMNYPNFRFYYKLNEGSEWEEMTVDMIGTELPDGRHGFIRNHIYSIVVKSTESRAVDGGIRVSLEESCW